jgi:hypothetical protein
MIVTSSNGTTSARMRIVEEHVTRENEHNLDGIMETFGETARYDDEGWGTGSPRGSRILRANAASHARLAY